MLRKLLFASCLLLTACGGSHDDAYKTDDYGRVDQGIAKNIQWGNNRLVIMSEKELTPMKKQLEEIGQALNLIAEKDKSCTPPKKPDVYDQISTVNALRQKCADYEFDKWRVGLPGGGARIPDNAEEQFTELCAKRHPFPKFPWLL